VFTLDAVTGGTPRQITDGKFSHAAPEWSADGRTIYVSGIRKPDAEYLDNDSEIYAIDLASLAVTALTDPQGPDANPAASPDGKWIAYTGFDDRRFTSHVSSLYLMDRAGGGKRVWAGALNDSPSNITWAADNSGIYYLVRELAAPRSTSCPRRRRSAEAEWRLAGTQRLSVASNGQAAAVRSPPLEPGHVAAFDITHPSAMKNWSTSTPTFSTAARWARSKSSGSRRKTASRFRAGS